MNPETNLLRPLLVRAIIETRDSMHAMLGMLDLLPEGNLDRVQHERLNTCRAAGDRLLRIAGDLDRLIAPPASGVPRTFSVRAAVQAAAELASGLARDKDLDVSAQIADDVPEQVTGDEEALSEALLRVLDNAVKFTRSGTVRIQVNVTAAAAETCTLAMEVIDSGPGMTTEDGPGLGLRVTRWLLAGMGGELGVASAPTGCRVSLTVPFGLPNSLTACSAAGSPFDILVAEDNDESYALVQAFLNPEGYRLTRAHNGTEAVDLARSGRFSLALMDIQMPLLDGFAATRAIRDWETANGRARMPVVVLSAVSFAHQVREGSLAGCSGYLVKPVRKPVLLDAVRTYAPAPGRPFSAQPGRRQRLPMEA